MASTTAGPRGRLLGAPKARSTAAPPTTPVPSASTTSSGASLPATARKTTATMTVAHPARRHALLIHGEPRTITATMPAIHAESTEPTSRAHAGRSTALSSSGCPNRLTTSSNNPSRNCASRPAATSMPSSLYLRRHSTATPTPMGMITAITTKVMPRMRATTSGSASKALMRSRSNPTSVLEAPVATSSPRSTRSTPMMRLSTSDGVRTCLSAGGSSISGYAGPSGSAGA